MSDLKRFQFNCVDGVEEEDKVYEKTKFLEVNEQGLGKISAQPHTSLYIQFLNRENND